MRDPSDMIIRDAVEADDTVVGELLVQAYLTQFAKKLPDVSYSPERLADLRNQMARRACASVLVAEIDGLIVGTVTLYPAGASGSDAWIAGAADLRLLAIHPDFQGRGLSGKLLDAAEALARKWGVPAICLHTRQGALGVREPSAPYQLRHSTLHGALGCSAKAGPITGRAPALA